MDFYKDFPERSDAGTATTPDGSVVAGSDKLNDNDYTMVGANGTGSNSQGKGYKVKFLSIYNYIKSKILGDTTMVVSKDTNGLMSREMYNNSINMNGREITMSGTSGRFIRIVKAIRPVSGNTDGWTKPAMCTVLAYSTYHYGGFTSMFNVIFNGTNVRVVGVAGNKAPSDSVTFYTHSRGEGLTDIYIELPNNPSTNPKGARISYMMSDYSYEATMDRFDSAPSEAVVINVV